MEAAGLLPVALHGALGHTQGRRNLVHLQAHEVTHLDHAHQPLVDGRQVCQRFVGRKDLLVVNGHRVTAAGVQRDKRLPAAPALGPGLTHQVNYHRTHHARRVGQEMAATVQRQLLQLHPTQMAFMQQRRGVEHLRAVAPAQPAVRDAAQVGVVRFVRAAHRARFPCPACWINSVISPNRTILP